MTQLRKLLQLRDRCEAEGADARRDGAYQYENPYHGVTQHEQFSAWREGWYSIMPVDFVSTVVAKKRATVRIP